MNINTSRITEASERLEAEMKRIQQEYQANAKSLIGDVFADFLRSYPNVKALYWTQYTPFFNDGEACEFSVHDLNALTEDDVREYMESNDIEDEADIYYDEFCDGEQSLNMLASEFTTTKLKEVQALIPQYQEWQADKVEYAKRNITLHQWDVDSAARELYGYNYSTFSRTHEQNQKAYEHALNKRVKSFKPHYKYDSLDEVLEDVQKIKANIERYGSFGDDCKAVDRAFMSIDDDALKNIYGDHTRVIVYLRDGELKVEVSEYNHD